MTPFSFIIIILYVLAFLCTGNDKERKQNLIVLTVILCIHFTAGYSFYIGERDVDFPLFCEILFLIFSYINLMKGSLDKKRCTTVLKKFSAVLICILIGYLFLFLVPVNEYIVTNGNTWDNYLQRHIPLQIPRFGANNILELLRVVLFGISYCTVQIIFDYSDLPKIIHKLAACSKIIVIFGLIEIIFKYLFHSNGWNNFVNSLMGLGKATYATLTIRGTGYMLQGFTKEASLYTFALFLTLFIFYADILLGYKEKKWILLIVIIMGFSMSFSSFLYLLIFVCVWFYRNWKKGGKYKKLFLGMLIFSFSLFLFTGMVFFTANSGRTDSYYNKRILSYIDTWKYILSGSGSVKISSNYIRMKSLVETFKLGLKRPLFGLGLGITNSLSPLAEAFSNIGIVGLIIFFQFLYKGFPDLNRRINNDINRTMYYFYLFLFIFACVFAGDSKILLYGFGNFVLVVSFSIMSGKQQTVNYRRGMKRVRVRWRK